MGHVSTTERDDDALRPWKGGYGIQRLFQRLARAKGEGRVVVRVLVSLNAVLLVCACFEDLGELFRHLCDRKHGEYPPGRDLLQQATDEW